MARLAGIILRGMIEPPPIVTSAVACRAVTDAAEAAQARIMVFAASGALLTSYPYVSPALPARGVEAQWLKSVAPVALPALANQPALAEARTDTRQESRMQTVITALGHAEGASKAACLATDEDLEAVRALLAPVAPLLTS